MYRFLLAVRFLYSPLANIKPKAKNENIDTWSNRKNWEINP